MNWQIVGSIAEILGAIAVLSTLIYLTVQVRQNTRTTEMSGMRDITAQWHHWGGLLAGSPDLAGVVAQGNMSYSNLSAEDALRYSAWAQTFFDIVESYLRVIRKLGLDEQVEVLTCIVRRRIAIPGLIEWWQANSGDYGRELVAWVEGLRQAGQQTGE